ncbi:MAG: hypothetical protein Q9174_003431 [Haloplaca sp. 1 TL-2023]
MAATLTRSHTNSGNEYDHAINLIDTTKPKNDATRESSDDAVESSGASLSRRLTRGTLRRELAKRKYAKWQQDRSHVEEDDCWTAKPTASKGAGEPSKPIQNTSRNGKDRETTVKGSRPPRSTRKSDGLKASQSQESIVDVLYENQRGWFLFGIPLYSANSLLNFDPASWQTSTFKDSPVNITNAQVPDPSWEWAWKTWYVDMSHDVDEEGWEYSFSFQSRFAWHGSHPWFHSFARRRRWLRQRIKVHRPRKDTAKDAHQLNADYFTIHGAKRNRSPGSSIEGTLANRSSYTGLDGHDSDSDQDLHDIPNVIALLAVLKKATVDREKIVAVRTFLAQGGEELHYLADNVDEIMGLLIYHTSREHLHNHLVEALDNVKTLKNSDEGKEESDPGEETRKIENLSRAVEASQKHLDGIEYLNDASTTRKIDSSTLGVEPAFGTTDADWPEEARAHIEEQKSTNEIRGIPAGADVDIAPSPLRTSHAQAESQASATEVLDKGKGREED